MTDFIPIPGQSFASFTEWKHKASSWLTARGGHPRHNDTEFGDKGYRGEHFAAMCFDQRGRRCRNGGDFMRADEEKAFPIWWIWPDQIYPLLMKDRTMPDQTFRKRDGSEGVFHAWRFEHTDTYKPGWLIQAIADNRACLRFGVPGEEPTIELYVDASGSTHPGRAYSKAKLGQWLVLRESGYVLVCTDEVFQADYVAEQPQEPEAA